MFKDDIFGCIDIGSSKIVCIIIKKDEDNFTVLGFAEDTASGIRNGVVVDLDSLAFVIEKVILKAEESANINIANLIINVSGSHIHSFDEHSIVNIEKTSKYIKEYHLQKALFKIQNTKLQEQDELIQIIFKDFKVDGQCGILNPCGMAGDKLEAVMHMVCGRNNFIQNLAAGIEKAGFGIINIFINSCLSAEAVLANEEKKLGVCLIDIGAGVSDIIIFKNGQIASSHVVPMAGNFITNGIAGALRLSFDNAEKVKCKYGYIEQSIPGKEQEMVLPDVSGKGLKKIPTKELSIIIDEKAENILKEIKQVLNEYNFLNEINSGIVVTGGTGLLSGLVPKMKDIFDCPVRLGSVNFNIQNNGHDKKISGPRYASLYGMFQMLLSGSYNKYNYSVHLSQFEIIKEKTKKFFFDIF